MSIRLLAFAVPILLIAATPQTARFHVVDVGHGDAAFVVSSSGETMLLDAGPGQVTDRLVAFMEQNGIKKVDYLVISHFEPDHMGAVAGMAAKVPIVNFVDHGESAVYNKSDDWWKQRRGPWFRAGMGKQYDRMFETYAQARQKARHIVVKPGNRIPIKGLEAYVVSAAGKTITTPLKGAGGSNAACQDVDRRSEDDAEDGQSVGVVLRHGEFRFVYLGDLTWNTANGLFCPKNLIGPVDAYIVTHHAQSMPRRFGDYYYGLSCCSVAELNGLRPRVAILSMGAGGHRDGTPEAMQVVKKSPRLEDLWQTQYVRGGGEAGENAPEQFVANLGGKSEKVLAISVTARADGSFTVTNNRNGHTKNYPARK